MTNLPATTLVCKSPPISTNNVNEYYGNRGLNLIRDDVFTSLANLVSATPSAGSIKSVIQNTTYNDTHSVDVTIWLEGYFSPQINSLYEFDLNTNGDAAILYISTDSTSANKVYLSLVTRANYEYN
jgi:hypothetical protein